MGNEYFTFWTALSAYRDSWLLFEEKLSVKLLFKVYGVCLLCVPVLCFCVAEVRRSCA